ncbi:glycosyltransferase [Bacillus coahuilensis]|uniref:glycosyltransferase n=1 Tax=Bacillus coahuilensis TaxID=408580 RepID=UPI0001851391|nr:glycosyltransferase [Bacillus coahuilensis]
MKIIDEFCDEGILKGEDVLFQCVDNYTPRNYKKFTLISDDDFKKILNEADVVVAHAGTGTVTSTLKLQKKLILFPRLVEYGEHGDNHQLDLCNLFESQNYVMVAKNKEELKSCLLGISSFNPKPFISNNDNINEIILNYLKTI